MHSSYSWTWLTSLSKLYKCIVCMCVYIYIYIYTWTCMTVVCGRDWWQAARKPGGEFHHKLPWYRGGVYLCICMYACVNVSACMCIYTSCTCMYLHIYIHTCILGANSSLKCCDLKAVCVCLYVCTCDYVCKGECVCMYVCTCDYVSMNISNILHAYI